MSELTRVLAVRLPAELERSLDFIVGGAGTERADFIRQAISEAVIGALLALADDHKRKRAALIGDVRAADQHAA